MDAIKHWRELAQQEKAAAELARRYGDVSSYFARARIYEQTAQALEIQRDTGVLVCSCCHKPLGDNLPYWQRGNTKKSKGRHGWPIVEL